MLPYATPLPFSLIKRTDTLSDNFPSILEPPEAWVHSSSDPCDNRFLRSQARRLIGEFTCVFRARPHYPLYQLQVDPLTGDFFVRVQPPEACVRTLVERRDGAEGAPLARRQNLVGTVCFCYFFVDLFRRHARRYPVSVSSNSGV